MKIILITGKTSQLAQCLKLIENDYADFQFIYTSSSELDITDSNAVKTYFKNNNIDYCINCAAYTAVDKAEDEPKQAKSLNTDGPKYLALACKESNITLIHISTDFVFDGKKGQPYTETDETNPLGIYGLTKRDGENEIIKHWKKHYIIRTSWLYSAYGNNFVKTMIRLSKEKEQLSVVNNQIGSPTYALDLANTILKIITSEKQAFGIYHYSNKGIISWFDFAKAILASLESEVDLRPITSSAYRTKALRPSYSVLRTTKTERVFNVKIQNWKERLETYLNSPTN